MNNSLKIIDLNSYRNFADKKKMFLYYTIYPIVYNSFIYNRQQNENLLEFSFPLKQFKCSRKKLSQTNLILIKLWIVNYIHIIK